MPKDVEILLDQYEEKFGEGFPLMQAPPSWEEIKKDIQQCLDQGITASKLRPSSYGACYGKNI